MAMLAERRRKQKWSLNPRGNQWSQDNNKFGQKMLEKMGWTHGKGLGAKLDGVTEHVKVSYKNDSKGMGFKETDEQWTQHENQFSALLESLKPDSTTSKDIDETKITPVSLEKKSQKSRARVHYHKFTRGKDLTRYSEKELANIFGKKSLKEKVPEVKKEEPESKINMNFSDDSNSNSNNQNFHNSGSMMDYFKKKLPKFGMKAEVKVDHSESESETCTSFGFGFKSESNNTNSVNFVSNFIKEESQQNELPKKRKSETKTNLTQNFISYVKEDENDLNTPSKKRKVEIIEDNPTEVVSKKKKKTKQKMKEENVGLSNPAFNLIFSTPHIEKHALTTISEDNDESSEINTSIASCNDFSDVSGQCKENNNTFNKKDKKLKKKDKNKGKLHNQLDNPCFVEGDSTENNESIIHNPYELTKKSKKQKIKNNGTCNKQQKSSEYIDNPCFNNTDFKNEDNGEDEQVIENENPYEIKIKNKQKKKNKQKIKDNFEFVNANFNDGLNEDSPSVNNDFEVKRKQKKSKNKLKNGLDNPCLNTNDSIPSEITEQNVEFTENFELKRKNKKLKKRENQSELVTTDNKSLDASNNSTIENDSLQITLPECDLMLNVVSTPIIQKPVLKQQNSSNKKRRNVRFSDVNEERIIPNNEELLKMEEAAIKNELIEIGAKIISNGIKNRKIDIEHNINSLANKIDGCHAELENDINEAKLKEVGEIGDSEGDHEKLSNGTVKLKYKYAKFEKKNRFYDNKPSDNFAKKSYKHLIRGDVIVDFNNSNLHEISGYGFLK